MTAFGIFAALLQLTVPSYAFRLVRRFGAQRVGWSVVAAFACLAVIHVLTPAGHLGASELTISAVLAITSVLLVVGLSHVEAVWKERENARLAQQDAQVGYETQFLNRTQDLARARQQLESQVQYLREREQVLADSAAQYEAIFAANPHPLCVADIETRSLLAVNGAALELLGWGAETLVTHTYTELVAEELRNDFLVSVNESGTASQSLGSWSFRRSDGVVLELAIKTATIPFSGRPARLLALHDTSEDAARLRQQFEIETSSRITRICSRLGQSFHQSVSEIDQQVRELRPAIPPSADVAVRSLTAGTQRGMALSRQLLAAGGCHPANPESVDINTMLRGLHALLTRMVGQHINLQFVFGNFTNRVAADPKLVEHIVLQLVLNARESIGTNGEIIISTAATRVDAPPFPDIQPGQFVRILVRDNGRGVPPDVRPRLFEPFFTTNQHRNALGLGLASCFGLARQQGGWLEHSGEPGRGAEFQLVLPCIQAASQASAGYATEQVACKGTVLLVQTDDRVRSTARCALNWKGYRVIEADSTALALLLWDTQSANIDLLLTDAALSDGISGVELGEQLQIAKPALRVVCLVEPGNEEAVREQHRWQLVEKPLVPETLVNRVETELA